MWASGRRQREHRQGGTRRHFRREKNLMCICTHNTNTCQSVIEINKIPRQHSFSPAQKFKHLIPIVAILSMIGLSVDSLERFLDFAIDAVDEVTKEHSTLGQFG